jgi:PAS domain S-box-containing protein
MASEEAFSMKGFRLSGLLAAVRPGASADHREARAAAMLDASTVELARLRESEARSRMVIDIAPVLIWMSGLDTQFTYFNQYWLDFTGRPIESELGYGWTKGIHADDLRQYEITYQDAFAHRRPFRTEFRLRGADGEYRWLLDVGTPMRDESGSFTGFVGSCLDITANKIAAHAVATISGRLIEAQEQERSRLARELHDDINQRLALLAIELEQLRLSPPGARKDQARRIDDLQHMTLEISRDVQALSHELHSSKLDFLGLVPAFSSFCREFSQQKSVEVRFTHADIPHSVPRHISLCLFRVLQEASHNVVKHSGVRRFDVDLRGMAGHLYLTIRDGGKGFDPGAAASARGLGLVSMRERLSLVGGTLAIRSAFAGGTEIFADVPLTRPAATPELSAIGDLRGEHQ